MKNMTLIKMTMLAALATLANNAGAVTTFPATIDFSGITSNPYYGAANVAPASGGGCPTAPSVDCYYQSGFAVGIAQDSSNIFAHFHDSGQSLLAVSDANGVYLRAIDSSSFKLVSFALNASISGNNPDSGPTDKWEILGFNTALNPTLDTGDGTNYSTRVAYQTVANGFNGTVTLTDPGFQNVSAIWIHYLGYPQSPQDGKGYEMILDNVVLNAAVSNVPIPAAVWLFGSAVAGLLAFGRRKATNTSA